MFLIKLIFISFDASPYLSVTEIGLSGNPPRVIIN